MNIAKGKRAGKKPNGEKEEESNGEKECKW